MRPPVRDHENFLQLADQFPEEFEPRIVCTVEEDRCRQEFKNETDLSFLLRKYGALPPLQSFPQAEVDFDLDLLSAKMAVEDARAAYDAFPRVLREQLSFQGFLAAVANGSFKVTRHPDGTTTAGGSAGGGASATSESASGENREAQ